MLEIYRAYRDADYMADHGLERLPWWKAIYVAFDDYRLLRSSCSAGIHIRLDVWGNRCWHERIQGYINGVEKRAARNPWNDPDVIWSPYDPHGLDEVDFPEPVREPVAAKGAVESAHWWRP